MKKIIPWLIAGLTFSLSVGANAALFDRGGGLIYDDVLNVTWLQDANYAQTSGYDADGGMTWGNAVAWVSDLSYYDSTLERQCAGRDKAAGHRGPIRTLVHQQTDGEALYDHHESLDAAAHQGGLAPPAYPRPASPICFVPGQQRQNAFRGPANPRAFRFQSHGTVCAPLDQDVAGSGKQCVADHQGRDEGSGLAGRLGLVRGGAWALPTGANRSASGT